MPVPKMGLFKFLKLSVFIAAMVLGALNSAESTVLVHFHRTPPAWSRFSTATFQYSVERPDGSTACRNNSCFIYCEIDGQPLKPRPVNIIVLKNLTANCKHKFLLNVTTSDGEKNSSAYSWFIDTVPPTATISSEQNYTSAETIAVDITFSEACTGLGGFNCLNSSKCDVIVGGPAHVQASSLKIIKPSIKYSLKIVIPLKSIYGRVVIRMADNLCTDPAGNHFMRTNGSVTVIRFDRRPVLVDLWASVPSYELAINGVPRTVLATNKVEDLEIFLDFSIPIINSTEQILNALDVNSGKLRPIHGRVQGHRRFVFILKNVSEAEIITVKLQAGLVVGITGSPVSPVASLTFIYDSTKPGVVLSTSSPSVTKESNINVIIKFTKPVFDFEASMVKVHGGRLTRLNELSRALYSLTILAVGQNLVSVTVPAGQVSDISGNLNLASERLEVVHYRAPPVAAALHSFVTAGILATSLAAAILSISSANLGAVDHLNSVSSNVVASDLSTNLQGMVGHLQVFVLSDWILADHPMEYSETTKGLRWIIPRQKLPWKRNGSSVWPKQVYATQGRLMKRFCSWLSGCPSDKRAFKDTDWVNPFYVQNELQFLPVFGPKYGWLHRRHNISKENTPYGLPLNKNEYFTYFLRGEPLSAGSVVKKMENYKGWQDFEMNLFWVGIGGGSLLIIHALIIIFLRLRTGTPAHGILAVPRFELILLILILPCISQSSAFLIRGGTTGGIVAGALLLAIPAAFILSVCLFLTIVVFSGSLAQYKEIRYVNSEEPWYKKLWFFFVGRPANGKWFFMEGLPSSFLPRFGILFEDQKGPPLFVFVDQNDSNTMPTWTGSGKIGIGRMRALSSDDSNEEVKVPFSTRFLGCARCAYIVLDLVRRVCLGILAGSYSLKGSNQRLFALAITLTQFLCLIILKPYLRRGVHLAESISLLCEVGIFGLSIGMSSSNLVKPKTLGFLMLGLLLLTFIAQIVNEWYGIIKCLLKLSQPQNNSFELGLKLAAKGFVLPFLPRKHWARVIHGASQPKTGLVPVLPLSPETEFIRRDTRRPRADQFSAMTATVVPVLSPGSPAIQARGSRTVETTFYGDGTRAKGIKLEPKSELKKLRELAKASFSGDSKGEGGSSSSYRLRPQSFPFSLEATSEDPQASSSKIKY